MTRLVLAMIVRDEAHTIARTIASALPHVNEWLIADTGSTDGTQEAVREAATGKPGRLLHVPFVDFSQARNVVLDAAEPGRVLLWLDADDLLVNGEALRGMLAIGRASCWSMRHEWSDGQTFTRPTIVRACSGWRFYGRVHEVLRHETERTAGLVGPYIRHELSARSIEKSRARYARDLVWLREALAEDPSDRRACFYLGRTLEALGRQEEAREAYAQRIALGGGPPADLEHARARLPRLE